MVQATSTSMIGRLTRMPDATRRWPCDKERESLSRPIGASGLDANPPQPTGITPHSRPVYKLFFFN